MNQTIYFGPVVRHTEAICGSCGGKLTTRFAGFYSCDHCNKWTNKVYVRTIPSNGVTATNFT